MVQLDAVEITQIIYICVISPPLWYVAHYVTIYYAESGTPKHTIITLRIGFFVSFLFLFLVPVDIASCVVGRKDWGGESDVVAQALYSSSRKVVSNCYTICYVITTLWGLAVLKYQDYLNTDGYFTRRQRACSALKRMLWDMLWPALVAVPVLIILYKTKMLPSNTDGIKVFSQLATNTIYTVLVSFLLGYGLIEFPRLLWDKADFDKQLLQMQTKAATAFTICLEARNALALEIASVLKTKDKIGTSDGQLVEAIGMMIAECPSEFRSSSFGEVAADKNGNVTIHTLAQLRTNMNEKKSAFRMAQARLEETQYGAYNLEDMVSAKNNPSQAFIYWSLRNVNSTPEERRWLLIVKPRLYRVAAVFCVVLSILTFLGIVSQLGSSKISVYFLAVHSVSDSRSNTLAGIIIFNFLTLAYVIIAIYWALFQMRSLFELVPKRTTPLALSGANKMMATLTFPIVFFYLGCLGENGIKDGDWMNFEIPLNVTAPVLNANGTTIGQSWSLQPIFMPPSFASFYPMASVPPIKKSYGFIYPVLLFSFMFIQLSKAFNRLCVLLKVPSWQFGDPILTTEQLAEGMRQLVRFRKIAERTVQRQELAKARAGDTSGDYPGLKFCGIWIFKPKKANKAQIVKSKATTLKVHLPEPTPLRGIILFKCAPKKRAKLKWIEIFAHVKPPGILCFAKSEAAAENNEVEAYLPTPIDLCIVLDFTVAMNDSKEGFRLKLELVDQSIKLRLDSEDEINKWKKGLFAWKQFRGMTDLLPSEQKLNAHNADNADASTSTIKLGNEGIELVNPLHFKALSTSAKTNDTIQKNGASHHESLIGKPASLEGYLGKKRSSAVANIPSFNKFQTRYFRVDESSGKLLYFYKENLDVPMGSIDLVTIAEVSSFNKETKMDNTRFSIYMPKSVEEEKVVKLKASTVEEQRMWVNGLNAWREYFIMQYSTNQAALYAETNYYENRNNDGESAPEILQTDNVQSQHDIDGTQSVNTNTDGDVDDRVSLDINDVLIDDEFDIEAGADPDSSSINEDGNAIDNERAIESSNNFNEDILESSSKSNMMEEFGISPTTNVAAHSVVVNPMRLTKAFSGSNVSTTQRSPQSRLNPPTPALKDVSGGTMQHPRSQNTPPNGVIIDREIAQHDSTDIDNDEEAYIKSIEKKYSKIAPQSTSLPKFSMPKFKGLGRK